MSNKHELMIHLPTLDATAAFGGNLAQSVPAGHFTLYFYGILGAGKTTLVRSMLRYWGETGAVKSPTYTLVEPYQIAGKDIYHFDLYRLEHPEALEFIGIRDYLQAGICLVEWAERGQDYLPPADIAIYLSIDNTGRSAKMIAGSAEGIRFFERFKCTQ